MPINNNIKPIHKMTDIIDTTIKTEYKCLEKEITVKLQEGSYLSWEDLKNYVPQFVNATWLKEPIYTDEEKERILLETFSGKHLPTIFETMKFTFKITGMTYIEVSHLLRHSNARFSAVCTGDRLLVQENIIVPEAIINSPELYERYKKTCDEQKQIYKELVDSRKVSIMDARYVLPRSLEQIYYMTVDYSTLMRIIKQRMDREIQPASDNLIAYQLWSEILRVYPKLKQLKLFDIDEVNTFYVKNATSERSTRLYLPQPQNDLFEYNPQSFIYQCRREELNGTNKSNNYINEFVKRYNHYRKEWNNEN